MSLDPSNTVVHLTLRRDENNLAVGSGVLYRKNDEFFIITAWHNVTGRHSTNLTPLSKTLAFPNNLIAYISCRRFSNSFNGYSRHPFTISLEEADKARYLVHPQCWPRIDVVAIPIDPELPYESEYTHPSGQRINIPCPMRQESSSIGLSSDIECIQEIEQAYSHINVDFAASLAVSDDLFILGYPRGITDMYGEPIWKRATVATKPQLGWQNQEKFLVDCASREGMSGAPVIFYSKSSQLQVGGLTYRGSGPLTIFHGIYVGRMGKVSEFEAQIGTVWQRKIVDEIIENGIPAPLSEHLEASPTEVRNAIHSSWPNTDNYESMLLEGNYIDGFTYSVMMELQGRANPVYVSEEILEIAKNKKNANN